MFITILNTPLGMEISTRIGYEAYPFLFRAMIMQRSMGDRVHGQKGNLVVIGSDIPPIRIMTLELRYFQRDQALHDNIYFRWIGELHKSEDDGTSGDSSGGRPSIGLLRLLCVAAFSPLLVKYFARATQARTISAFIGRLVNGRDQGFGTFSMATCNDVSVPRLKNAPERAFYLRRRSPRLSMLLRILDLEGAFATPRPHFLLVCHWLIVAWMVEMFTIRLRLRTVSITAFYVPRVLEPQVWVSVQSGHHGDNSAMATGRR